MPGPVPGPRRTAPDPSGSGSPRAGDCRCECGSLLARVVPDGIELKCRRCKRVMLVPVALARGTVPGAALRVVAPEPRARVAHASSLPKSPPFRDQRP